MLFPPGLFTLEFMQNAWVAGTAVAIVGGVVGFFVVLRGATFVAHAVPRASFAGAAGAALVGQSSALGLGTFAVLSALGIASISRERRHGVATALILAAALGLGDLFLTIGHVYAPAVFALLFGQIVGISTPDVHAVLIVSAITVVLFAATFRPLLLQTVSPHVAEARGFWTRGLEVWFLLLVSGAAAAMVPVVGALLAFSLMVGPAATGSIIGKSPLKALGWSIVFGVLSLWLSVWLAYLTFWPIGFFVSGFCLLFYAAARLITRP
jgi:zinc/manganese transport system permease protein